MRTEFFSVTIHPSKWPLRCMLLLCHFAAAAIVAEEPVLLGHWPLTRDFQNQAAAPDSLKSHGVQLTGEAARFDGIDDWLEVRDSNVQSLGNQDFTVSLRLRLEDQADDVPGDLISLYDPARRRGFHLSLKTHEVTMSRTNSRTTHFGIDNNQIESAWKDHGRVGEAVFIFAFAVHQGRLFVGSCEPHSGQSGRVYRWDGDDRWIDCKIPVKCNSVSSLLVHDGNLYAGTAKYRLAGSALKESDNAELGGQILRYESDGKWEDCGQLPGTEAVGGMTVFGGRIYTTSLYRPAGFFRYEGGRNWTPLDPPQGKRVEAFCVYNGQMFASSYDEAHVFRFDGERWTDCGQVGDATNTQTYSLAVYHGHLYVGTWRSGKVFRYQGDRNWVDCGRLGEELEVMGMLVHNGRLLAGSLPLAGVFQYEGDQSWTSLGVVDSTPDVMYRRAWTLAEYQGRAFVGTLPAGRVLSIAAGVNVTYDREFPTGWHHLAARRAGSKLSLFLDGERIGDSVSFEPDRYNLTVDVPLKIGLGPNDYFRGQMRDVRIYRGALSEEALQQLSNTRP